MLDNLGSNIVVYAQLTYFDTLLIAYHYQIVMNNIMRV